MNFQQNHKEVEEEDHLQIHFSFSNKTICIVLQILVPQLIPGLSESIFNLFFFFYFITLAEGGGNCSFLCRVNICLVVKFKGTEQ